MKNFLTEKLLLDPQHGKDCTLEVCIAGEPDADRLICKGTVSQCLRTCMNHDLAMSGDEYFSLTTDRDNYFGYSFDDISFALGFLPDTLSEILSEKPSLDSQIGAATAKKETIMSADPQCRESDIQR